MIGQPIDAHPWPPIIGGLGLVAKAPPRAATAVVRGANDFVITVIVGRVGVFVEIEAGKALGAFTVNWVRRIGQAEEIEVDIALTLVKLIIAQLILFVHHACPRQLRGNAIPDVLAVCKQMVAATEQVKERPIVGTFVKIIGPIA